MLTRISLIVLALVVGVAGVMPAPKTGVTKIWEPIYDKQSPNSSALRPYSAPQRETTGEVGYGDPFHPNMLDKCGQWYTTAIDAGWPESEWPTISKVMWRESRCDPNAWNGADAGLMQINRIHTRYVAEMGMVWPWDMFDPTSNLEYARSLWERAGWEPWIFKGVVPGE